MTDQWIDADGVIRLRGTFTGGGSQTVRTETVPIAYTDIDAATGLADLYLLPENETLFAVGPIICSEAFDGANPGGDFFGVQCFGPSGHQGELTVSDTFDPLEVNASTDGLLSASPPDNGWVLDFFTGVTPVQGDGPVQLTVDFSGGNDPPFDPPFDIGTQGQMDICLILLVRS